MNFLCRRKQKKAMKFVLHSLEEYFLYYAISQPIYVKTRYNKNCCMGGERNYWVGCSFIVHQKWTIITGSNTNWDYRTFSSGLRLNPVVPVEATNWD